MIPNALVAVVKNSVRQMAGRHFQDDIGLENFSSDIDAQAARNKIDEEMIGEIFTLITKYAERHAAGFPQSGGPNWAHVRGCKNLVTVDKDVTTISMQSVGAKLLAHQGAIRNNTPPKGVETIAARAKTKAGATTPLSSNRGKLKQNGVPDSAKVAAKTIVTTGVENISKENHESANLVSGSREKKRAANSSGGKGRRRRQEETTPLGERLGLPQKKLKAIPMQGKKLFDDK